MPNLFFSGENALVNKTFFTQEMLDNGFLGSGLIYFSTAHTEDIIDKYAIVADSILNKIQVQKEKIVELIRGPICHSAFKRLT